MRLDQTFIASAFVAASSVAAKPLPTNPVPEIASAQNAPRMAGVPGVSTASSSERTDKSLDASEDIVVKGSGPEAVK